MCSSGHRRHIHQLVQSLVGARVGAHMYQHALVIRGTGAQPTLNDHNLTVSLLCFQRKASYTEAQMRTTTTDLGPQTQRLQMAPTAVRRAAQLCPVMETEIWDSTASRTPPETPRAQVELPQARSPMGRPTGARGPNPRGSALAQTPSQESPVEPGLPSPTSNWWLWRTSLSPRATCQCASGSTWPCHCPSLRPRSRSGSRTAGPSGRNRTPAPTPLPPPAPEVPGAQVEEQEAWGASVLSARPLRSAATWPCMLGTPATTTPPRAAWSSCLSLPPATSCPPSCWGRRATLPPLSIARTCRDTHAHTHLTNTSSETH